MVQHAMRAVWLLRLLVNVETAIWIDHCSYRRSNAPTLLFSKASEVDDLLHAISALVSLVSPEKVQAIAARVRRTEASKATWTLPSVVSTPVAGVVVGQMQKRGLIRYDQLNFLKTRYDWSDLKAANL